MGVFEWGLISTLIVLNTYLFRKLRSHNNRLMHLVRVINHIAKESADANWNATRNKNDIRLIKDALQLKETA